MKTRRVVHRPKQRKKNGNNNPGVSPPYRASEEEPVFRPRINGSLKSVLQKVGAPEDRPFTPDPFQVEAISRLKEGDVVVSAPTGSGKTYIAVEAMKKLVSENKRIWYASPLKALSNSKFIEFGAEFGTAMVGLLTGDHKVNPDAPIIVGTTEILRNQLYDAMDRGFDLAVDLVVMDEAHYLGDPDRGVVWEETIIYLPVRVRLLLLSATVDNAREIADWLTHVRGAKARAVISNERPVPLYQLFLFPDGELTSLSRGRILNPKVRHFLAQNPFRGRRFRRVAAPYGRILNVLAQADLLPAIFFLKSRADCDQALTRGHAAGLVPDLETRKKLEQRIEELTDRYPFLKKHAHLKYIMGSGLAAHHAGHLPHWKLLVEQLMQEGLLKAIFSTSTVAAGVNFPARTVVVCQSDRFNGHEFMDLTATDLLQMTGRAGRRGMDNIGFALVVPGPYQDTQLLHSLFKAKPEPVLSQININFSMALNLLSSHEPEQIKNLLDLSLASYQQKRRQMSAELVEALERLASLIEGGCCHDPEEALYLYGQSIKLESEFHYWQKRRPEMIRETGLREGLVPGRLFEVYGGQVYCAFQPDERRGRAGILAAKVREDAGLRKGQVRLKWVPLGRIYQLLETRLDLGPMTDPSDAVLLIRAAALVDHPSLDHDVLAVESMDQGLVKMETRLEELHKELDGLACSHCPIRADCLGDRKSEPSRIIRKINALDDQSAMTGRLLWAAFIKHFEFLKKEGFVLPDGQLTPDGYWAAQLRLDHPLIFAAGIKASAWPEDDPALLAAMVAPFVVDKEQMAEEEGPKPSPVLAAAFIKLEQAITPLWERLVSAGFTVPKLRAKPALAIHHWAGQGQWEEAVRLYGQDPGDMAMLVFRTADNLRQLASLSATHPRLAPTARAAVELILKEPVITPL